jgi:carbamoyltransferase
VALSVWHQELNMQRKETYTDQMKGAYLGPSFDDKSIEVALRKLNANYKMVDQETMLDYTAAKISKGKAVGWFQGRMEFGPRALGNRSILGDPRSSKMQKNLNLKVKFRESFRPFAPSIIFEELQEWFDLDQESPYMLLVDHVNADKQIKMSEKEKKLFGIEKLNIKRSKIPSVTHVDYSARIQTVHNKTNPLYYSLIKKFKEITGCPVLINTSFNVRGEPIVCTPKDAFNCFMGTNMDNLIIGNFILNKEDQDQSLLSNYKDKYELD